MQERQFKTVLGMYPTRSEVEIAVEAFRDAGFRFADISLVLPEAMTYEGFYDGSAVASAEALSCDTEVSTTEAGPVAQSLGNTLAAASELAAALVDLGIPGYETHDYAGKLMAGKALVSIHCDSPEKTLAARRLHGDLGGMDVFIAHCTEQEVEHNCSMAFSAGK